MMNVVVVGAGAVGMVVGNSLSGWCDLKFALDSNRIQRIKRSDCFFNDKSCDINSFTPSINDSKADLIIITTKASGLDDALDLIEPIVGSDTIILPLLNGVLAPQIIENRYGSNRTLYGLYLGHTATRVGNRVWHDGQFKLIFGRETNDLPEVDSKLMSVKNLFDTASLQNEIPIDMKRAIWHKLIVNIGVNQVTAALRCNYGYIKQSTQAQLLMRNLMQEAVMVAKLEGVNNADALLDEAFKVLWDLNSEDGSSMYQDIMAARVTELNFFGEYIVSMAQKHGVLVPSNSAICVMIRQLEQLFCR